MLTHNARSLRIAFFGSSLVSAYWNGAATYYRGILKALHARGHTSRTPTNGKQIVICRPTRLTPASLFIRATPPSHRSPRWSERPRRTPTC